MEETWEHALAAWIILITSELFYVKDASSENQAQGWHRHHHPLMRLATLPFAQDPSTKTWVGNSCMISQSWHNNEPILAGKIHHLAPPYRYVIIYFCERGMRTYFRALSAGQIPIMSELLHVMKASSEPRAPGSHKQHRHPWLCWAS